MEKKTENISHTSLLFLIHAFATQAKDECLRETEQVAKEAEMSFTNQLLQAEVQLEVRDSVPPFI